MTVDLEFFRGAKGLNNKVSPSRIEQGDLATAFNVDIDDSGKVSRASSFVASVTLPDASYLYWNGEHGFLTASGSMYQVQQNLSLNLIATGLTTGARTRYETVYNTTYFVDEHTTGKIVNGIASDWVAAEYVGPTTYKQFQNPPVGHLLRYFSSRMYIGDNNTLWYSEPFSYSQFDKARCYVMLNSRLKMISAVQDGLYVSTDKCIYFLGGLNPT
jgi:hypothetical protein